VPTFVRNRQKLYRVAILKKIDDIQTDRHPDVTSVTYINGEPKIATYDLLLIMHQLCNTV